MASSYSSNWGTQTDHKIQPNHLANAGSKLCRASAVQHGTWAFDPFQWTHCHQAPFLDKLCQPWLSMTSASRPRFCIMCTSLCSHTCNTTSSSTQWGNGELQWACLSAKSPRLNLWGSGCKEDHQGIEPLVKQDHQESSLELQDAGHMLEENCHPVQPPKGPHPGPPASAPHVELDKECATLTSVF